MESTFFKWNLQHLHKPRLSSRKRIGSKTFLIPSFESSSLAMTSRWGWHLRGCFVHVETDSACRGDNLWQASITHCCLPSSSFSSKGGWRRFLFFWTWQRIQRWSPFWFLPAAPRSLWRFGPQGSFVSFNNGVLGWLFTCWWIFHLRHQQWLFFWFLPFL